MRAQPLRAPEPIARPGWILGPLGDALIFSGPLVAAFALIGWAYSNGTLYRDMPPWMFALLVVACDVAHVYATAFRVYLDPVRFKRRPALFVGVPVACFAAGALLYGFGADVFWRVLAYLAVWHFVRQQWGWVAFTRAKAGEDNRDRRLDQAMIYAVTLYPLVHWHTHMPADFQWFVQGDFVALPGMVEKVARAAYLVVVGAFGTNQVLRLWRGLGVNWAKLHVIGATWIAWYGGIVLIGSDIAFTALNVLSHGVPYLAVVYVVERRHAETNDVPLARWFAPRVAALLLVALVLVGYAEELLWDSLVWRDHPMLFAWVTEGPLPFALLGLVVPLLAVPQATHYVLDGWLWRRREHTDLGVLFERSSRE